MEASVSDREPGESRARGARAGGFRELCEQVCAEQGWRLRPNGIHVPLPGGRNQVVGLELVELEDEHLVRLATVIGSAEGLSPVRLRAALELNAVIPHGAFAVRDGELLMTDTLPLGEAHAGELESTVRSLAETADRYEEQLFRTDDH